MTNEKQPPEVRERIIDPIDPQLIQAELTPDLMLRHTNRAKNEIYTFKAKQAPHAMQELGRLREEAFRYYGGGSGKSVDIDEFDTDTDGYSQLIVWDPSEKAIIGGYRYILGDTVSVTDGEPHLASAEIFRFSPTFVSDYLPRTIELGRSFVRLDYQQSKLSPKSLFALDNLWDGLGALLLLHEDYDYFFGKVTMYKDYNRIARDLIIYFLHRHFQDPDALITPLHPVPYELTEEEMSGIILGKDAKVDYKRLNTAVRTLTHNIPPLVNAYMGLSSAMKVFGTSINPDFSGVEETAILIPVEEISEEKKKRHMESFLRDVSSKLRPTLLQRIRRSIRRH